MTIPTRMWRRAQPSGAFAVLPLSPSQKHHCWSGVGGEVEEFSGAWAQFRWYCVKGVLRREDTRRDHLIYSPPNTNNEVNFWLSWDIEVTSSTSSALEANFFPLLCKVFLHIRLCALEYNLAFCLCALQKKTLTCKLKMQQNMKEYAWIQSRKMV